MNPSETVPKRGSDTSYRLKGQEGTSFPSNKTALLVIDPVNDFLSEGGAAYELTKATLQAVNVIENLKKAIEGARARGIPVLYGPMAYTEEDYKEHELHRRSSINRMMFEHKMFLAGSWGADFHPELTPTDEDIVLLPHKSLDVFETDLPEQLERLNISHLVIAGMTANLCCESTGRHAMERGYDVTFLSDAIGSTNIPSYEAAVTINYPMIANGIMKAEEFLTAIDALMQARSSIAQGHTVVGSDHGEIGTVEKLVAETADTEAHLVVPRGIIFSKDLYIPLDAVVKLSGMKAFINMPKMVIDSMPWDKPPAKDARKTMQGPKAEDVAKLYRSRAPAKQAD